MNREIKFRAWDGEKMSKPFELVEIINQLPEGVQGGAYIKQDDYHFTIYSEKLMQYTGLKDKNGREIYEGDIIETGTKEELFKVFYNSATACFDIEYLGGDNEPMVSENGWREDLKEYKYKVIGNIYQNPELCAPPTE